MSKDEKIVEIVSSINSKNFLERCGNKNLIIALLLNLEIGKLDSIENFNRNNLEKYFDYSKQKPSINDFNFK